MNFLTNDILAQEAHVGWGGMLSFILNRYVYKHRGIAALVVLIFAFLKELGESLGIAFWEGKQSWGSSAEDFAFWAVGIGLFVFFTSKYSKSSEN